MTTNRKAAEAFIIKYITAITQSNENAEIYRQLFAGMDDKAFDDWITKIGNDENRLAVITPNFSKTTKVTVENNLKIAEELGHHFFERIWFPADDNSPAYLSPVKYLVIDLPLRRQAQLLVKKISIPENNSSVDDFTGQPTGVSKGSKISYPEMQVMAAMGLDNCTTELIKYRGGDIKGFQAMNTSIARTGRVSQAEIAPYASGVESTKTLKTFLNSMHLEVAGL